MGNIYNYNLWRHNIAIEAALELLEVYFLLRTMNLWMPLHKAGRTLQMFLNIQISFTAQKYVLANEKQQ